MKTKAYEISNYKDATLLLIKEKLPLFFLGLLITTYFSFLILSNLKIVLRNTTSRVQKADGMHVEKIKTYTVKLNDDLWGISEKMYGSGYNAPDIAKANNLAEPFILTENQILVIPSLAPKKPTQGEITSKAAQTTKITDYVVLPGEYLWQIAEKIYGDGNQMSKLIDANRIPYPFNVDEGQKLLVP